MRLSSTYFPDDEMLLTQASGAQQLFSGINWIPEGLELQEYTLREGEGLTIKQITNSTVGNVTWIVPIWCGGGLMPTTIYILTLTVQIAFLP